ncbi:gliding motility-associated C-terminal domain-containing protein [Chryseobacterium sp. PS-8]|uniref:Gliding motility-associated C-terminal domain-containing protein n=1 Tax=Chryseobacterium indicum TaxID=2766954 RepID=A0ABS9C7J2_9FLAO|nr:gliding motility-associated C-terminal domain-containing protein [Chryseobacterium sp. PS-8]MCF2220245.1 gliding motility-associated C-terminal domain-containing protein [Chryseobacterium sp. PS-8]
MNKILLSFVLMFFSISTIFAQRDTEHWIAPYYASTTGYTNAVYLSTDSTTPFDVKIYSNNALLTTVTISKGNPQTYSVPLVNITATATTDAFTVINKGLYLKGDKPFYCTLRSAQTAHGEIITSKGKAGIGKLFFAANAPNTSAGTGTSNNFTAGILATEDNTQVTVTWTTSGIQFIGAPSTFTGNSQTFTLNKGQSYILAGNNGTSANLTGFIGAKVVSDKPISLTNGSANGNFGAGTSGGSDLIMDQSVPVERLGNTFAMVKTKSTAPAENMEGGIVIATEDNTQIFVNGGTTPLATINAGEWYRINETNYVQQGTSGHFNMLVSTSKNVYLYQLVGVGTANNTGGYNYIPPLNCFLPRKIDEIGKINEMPGISGITLKLNILTETGAAVTYSIDGGPATTPTAAQGPYPLTGNTNWVTYAIDNPTGNVTVTSTKAVTAGVNGGYSTAGYGGYFAGFSSIPLIAKQTGDCIPGIILEVDDSYETYQWYLNGNPIPGATQNVYTPTVAGNYTVKVTMGTCPPVTTPIYKVFSCVKNTTAALNACATKVITPAFSFTTTQTPVASTVTILTYPANGTATVNSSGQITYIPNPGYLGPDTIVYQFCGNAPEFIDCEKVTLNLTVVPFILTDTTIKACQYNGKGFFDLTSANVTTYTPVVKKFYPTLADLNAATNEITNPASYLSAAGNVYVKVTTNEGCTGNAKITLAYLPTPVVMEATISECYLENNETKAAFNLSLANVSAESPITKKYYPTFVDASNGTNEILNPLAYVSGNASVYIRVYNSNGCYAIAKVNLVVIPPKRSAVLVDKIICIDGRTNLDAGPGYQSYLWSTGATTQVLSGVPVGDYWVILKDNGCSVKQFVSVKKAVDPVISEIEISNNTATVKVTGGQAPYKYAVDSPANWQDSNVFTGLSRGQHTFYVKDAYNCTPIFVEVTVPNLLNAITPNGDNKNDFIDYSELAYKENLSFVVYDRYGNKIFTGNKFNNYKWDGKHFDKKIVTGTYWYHINWNEPNKEKTPIKYSGWILVKNID